MPATRLTLTGCGQTSAALASGVYTASSDETALPPSLTLDMDEQRFTFTHDPLSSYLSVGSFVLTDDKLTASTDDGRCIYVFELTTQDALTLVPDESSRLPSPSGYALTADHITLHFQEE